MANDVAVLGVGMHPWGKWGRPFVEYGVAAARSALDDAGLTWRDVGFIAGPALVAVAARLAAPGWRSRGCARRCGGGSRGRRTR